MRRPRLALVALLLLGSSAAARANMPYWTAIYGGQAWIRAIAIDPQTPTTIYLGLSNGGLEVPVQGEARGIVKTTNAGLTWQQANVGLTDLFVVTMAVDPVTPSTVFAGTDGSGIFRSTNAGASWTAVNAGLEGLEVYALAFDPTAHTTIYAGTDEGVSKSIDGGDTWTHQPGIPEEVWSFAIHPSAPSTVYAGTLHGNGVYKTTDGGTTWSATGQLRSHDPVSNTDVPSSYITGLAIDPVTPSTVWAGSGDNRGMFKSLNGGQSWTSVSTGLENDLPYPYFLSMVLDPIQPSTVYVGTYQNGILRTTNGGATWLPVVAGLRAGPGTAISALAVDSQGTIYAGTSDRRAHRLETIPLGVGRFLCYKASGRSVNRTATLADDFHGPANARITRPAAFCTPVDVSGLASPDPTTHLTCYRVSTARPTDVPLFSNVSDLDTRHHSIRKAETVCLPSEGTGPSALALDDFECYRPTRSEFPTNVVPPRDAMLTGAFGSWHSRWLHVASFCSPVSRDGSAIREPAAHLACYEFAKGPSGSSTITNPPFARQTITVENAFGQQEVRLIEPETLCVPALRE